MLNLLVQPIRQDLGISDTQISLLQGIAFAIFYSVLGVPIARLADRGNRRNIIAAGIFLWCLMTAACGLARNFVQL
ncbi:MAG: MFS transporter, partial [Planctomycetales bacterium]|nr:MFS transporter [Planctomycetales bacterium]